jgi:2-keto-4-pentenoate hydratase
VNSAENIAAQVVNYRRHGRRLTLQDPPWEIGSVDEANRIQDRVAALIDEPVVGWKVGAANPETQKKRGITEPFIGRVFASRLLNSPARLSPLILPPCIVECELAACLGFDLPAGRRFEAAEVEAAVASWHPAYEIVDFSWPDWTKLGIRDFIADNGGCGGMVVGAPTANWKHIDLRHQKVTLRIADEIKAAATINTDWGELVSLVRWLANHLSGRGISLGSGTYIATGTLTGLTTVAAGQVAEADFSVFGSISASLAAG